MIYKCSPYEMLGRTERELHAVWSATMPLLDELRREDGGG